MSSEKEILADVSWQDCKTFVPAVNFGKVIKVYDGDSITIATVATVYTNLIDAGIYRFSVRLNGIDTPEMRTKNESEKKAARVVQKKLEDKLLGKFVSLKNVRYEKYGRLLCDVYLEDKDGEDDTSINQWLLKNNLAVSYDGGTKNSPDNWLSFMGLEE